MSLTCLFGQDRAIFSITEELAVAVFFRNDDRSGAIFTLALFLPS
jgi:hypothetical protein